jgi:hypothetical protein
MKKLFQLHSPLMSPSLQNQRQSPGQGASVQFKVTKQNNILRNICKFVGLARIRQYTKMLPHHISIICLGPLGRIDDVALRRWALFKVE